MVVSISTRNQRGISDVKRYLERELTLLKEGDPLPPLRQMMQETGAGQRKLSQVLDMLQDEGLVKREHRSGIFKARSTNVPELVPYIDVAYCDCLNADIYTSNTPVHGQLFLEFARAIAARHQGLRAEWLPAEAPLGQFDQFLRKPELKACVLVGLHSPDYVEVLARRHIAWVSVLPRTAEVTKNSILWDAFGQVALTLEHLWSLGHERIAFLHRCADETSSSFLRQLRDAFYALMARKELPVRPNWVQYGGFTREDTVAALDEVLSGEVLPTAAVISDRQMPWAYAYLQEKGMKVGEDFSLVGTEDMSMAAELAPKPTTTRTNKPAVVKQVLNSLDCVLRGELDMPVQYMSEELVVGASSGPAPG